MMKITFVTLLLVFCLISGSLSSSKQSKKSHHMKTATVQVPVATTTNRQVANLKQQVHIYTVWVRRTLDDCKRDDENDRRFDEQKAELDLDHGDFHLKSMNDIVDKKKSIAKDIAADLNKSITAYKVMQNNPLFSKLYLETERCYPDNFVPQGFQADQLAKMRFVELK